MATLEEQIRNYRTQHQEEQGNLMQQIREWRQPTVEAPEPAGPEIIKREKADPEVARSFYDSSAMSAPFQGLPPFVWSPDIAAQVGRIGIGPEPPGGFDELGRPVDEHGKAYGTDDKEVLPPGLYAYQRKPTFLQRIIRGFAQSWDLSEPELKLSEKAKAQAVIRHMAKESGMKLSEYRQSPEFIEQAASTFVNMASFGTVGTMEEGLHGEELFEPTDTLGYVGHAIGSLAGLALGPFQAARATTAKALPRATRDMPLTARISKEAIHDAVLLGTALGAVSSVEALKETTFTDAADHIFKGVVEGALIGAIFGIARGMFPREGVETGTRMISGLAGIMAYRAAQVGGNPFTDRPAGEVMVDIALDAFFLYRGLPRAQLPHNVKMIEDLRNKADIITKQEAVVDKISDQFIKDTQKRILEAEKKQLDAKIDEAFKKLKMDMDIAQDMLMQMEAVERAKVLPEPKKSVVSPKAKPPKPDVKPKTEKVSGETKPAEAIKEPKPERVSEIDQKLGIEEKPKTLEGDKSPFLMDKETTDIRHQTFEQRGHNIGNNPDTYVQYLITQANRWRHGENVPIGEVRHKLSDMAAMADGLRSKTDWFLDGESHRSWSNMTKEAADWARKVERAEPEFRGIDKLLRTPDEAVRKPDRTKIERTPERRPTEKEVRERIDDPFSEKPDWGSELYSMVPLHKVPDAVRSFFEGIKKEAVVENIYRNKKMWQETGFWYAKDGKWRHETLPHHIKMADRSELPIPGYEVPITQLVKPQSRIFEIIPGLKNTMVEFVPRSELKSKAAYDPVGDVIALTKRRDITWQDLSHEAQHAIGHKTITFHGTNPSRAANARYRQVLDQMWLHVADKGVRRTIEKMMEESMRGRELSPDQMNRRLYELSDHFRDVEAINAVKEYLTNPGEMEGRLSERRDGMTARQKRLEAPWETLDRMLAGEYFDFRRHIEGVDAPVPGGIRSYVSEGHKLYSGIDIKSAAKAIDKMAKPAVDFVRKFRSDTKAKSFDLGYAVKQLKDNSGQALLDLNQKLLNDIRKNYPHEFQRISSTFRSADTGRGYGAVLYEQAAREIYSGKNKQMKELIDIYVLGKRFKEIYSYKPNYKGPKDYGPTQSVRIAEIIDMAKDADSGTWALVRNESAMMKEILGNLSKEQVVDVIKAGETYFEWSRRMIDDLVEAGIKTPEEGRLLKAHDFRKFRSVQLDQLYDMKVRHPTDKSLKTTYSGVEALGKGKPTKILDTDGRVVLSEQFRRVYGSIKNQEAKTAWRDFAVRHPDNSIVSTKKRQGWATLPYYDQGKLSNLYVHPDAAKYMMTKSGDFSPWWHKWLRRLTAAAITKPLAIGTSPTWATFIGLPMDVTLSIMASKTWNPNKPHMFGKGTGKYEMLYSPLLPKAGAEIALDMSRVLSDVTVRGPLTKDLMKHGLVMNFLTTRESKYMRGARPPGGWDKMLDVASYHGLSMELWVRVANADRVIRKRAAEQGLTYEQARKNREIMDEAVHVARDRLDYNQGGRFVKALENSGFIYTNAAVLGARSYWRQASTNPVDFSFRTAQIGIGAAGMTATMLLLYPEEYQNSRKEGNHNNILFPILPGILRTEDEHGNVLTFHGKLRMDPGAAFAYRLFEGLTHVYLYDQGYTNIEPDLKRIVRGLKDTGPVGFNLPPSLQSGVDYFSNYSWWQDRQMYTDMGGKKLPYPMSRHEGAEDPNVPQWAKDVGSVTGLSPKRTHGAVGATIPYNNEWVYIMNQGYEFLRGVPSEEKRSRTWMESMAEVPGINRVIGLTRSSSHRYGIMNQEEEQVALQTMLRNTKVNRKIAEYAFHGIGDRRDVVKEILSHDQKYFRNLSDRLKFAEHPLVKTLPNRRWWLSFHGQSLEGKARSWIRIYENASESGKAQLNREWAQVKAIGIISGELEVEIARQGAEARRSQTLE